MRAVLKKYVPSLEWGARYSRNDLRGDLSAGLTVGVMLIPQGMAYALIAGLPPIYGLYASFVPLLLYALLGSSRQLAVGPVAMVSLLVAAGVAPLAGGDAERYIMLSLALVTIVGAIQLVLGLARFGFLANFLSHPVLAGFTSAAALIIGFSQLNHLLGVDLPRSNYVHEILWSAIEQAGEIHGLTLLIGLGSIALLIGLRRWKAQLPGALIVVVVTTFLVGLLGLDEQQVSIVGDVPGGLPAPVLPLVSWQDVQALIPSALIISLVGFMESIAVAKVYASRHRYEVDANQELVALGMANLGGAFFHSYPVAGGFSRTAVNDRAGARTPLASVISAALIGLTLALLTPLFYYMPNAVLAAIVIVAVAGLVDVKEALYLWRTNRYDFGLMALTFVATLTLGIEEGILVGVVASMLLVLYQSSRPHTVVMGQLPESTTYRNVERHPEALVREGVAVVRIDSSLYFANAAHLKDTLRSLLDGREKSLRAIVFDMYPVNDIDSTAIHALTELVEELHQAGIDLYVAGAKGPVRDALERCDVVAIIGEDRFFLEVYEAVEAAAEAQSIRPLSEDGTDRSTAVQPEFTGGER